MNLRSVVLWAVAACILGWTSLLIFQKEQDIAYGRPIFLELVPVDPRSLIQGDYMDLRYAIARAAQDEAIATSGALVIALDGRSIARYVRVHNPAQPLASGELLLRYHQRNGSVYLGAESFFFQEGQAIRYEDARYGELRVAASGESVLVELRGPELQELSAEGT